MKVEKYRSILKEHFLKLLQLNELDVIDDNPEENPNFTPEAPSSSWEPSRTVDLSEPEDVRPDIDVKTNEYSTLGKSITNVSSKLSPELKSKAESEITRILETGRSKMTHELYVGADPAKKNVFEYVTSVLGALYNETSSRQQNNIRTFMFTAFNPYGDSHGGSSKLARMIGRNAGITYDLTASKTIDAEYYMGIITEGIYKAIDYALKNYNPDQTSFGRFVFIKGASETIDGIKEKKYKTAFTGFGKTSGDDPLGGEGDEGEETAFDRMQASEEGFTKEQKEGMKQLYSTIGAFVRAKLSNPKLKSLLEYYILFAEKGHTNDEISEFTGESNVNLRQRKFKIEKLLTQFVEDGSLPRFIKEKAGINIKFPNNKFSLSAKNDEEKSTEPMYIFKANPDNPAEGEWVEIKKSNKLKRYMTADTLGDIAFGKGEEEGNEEAGTEEGPLAEVRDMVRNFLSEDMHPKTLDAVGDYFADRIANIIFPEYEEKDRPAVMNAVAKKIIERYVNKPGISERFLGFGKPQVKKNDDLIATLNDEGKLFDAYLSNMDMRVRKRVQSDGKNRYNSETIKNFENMTLRFVLDTIKGSTEEARRKIEQVYPPKLEMPAEPASNVNEEAQEIDEERITNDEGKEFVKRKENFIGSHCWGEKLGDGSYVAASYGKHFPIYIFWNKKNRWYENSDHYIFGGEPQESTEEHRMDIRPTDETIKKSADWMRKLSNHLLKVNGMTDYEHISVEPGTKN